jgi:phenylalanyl-tRNA synthetase alpha subunit
MKIFAVLLLSIVVTLSVHAQEVDYNGITYKIKGKSISQNGTDVSAKLSVTEQIGIREALRQQKAFDEQQQKSEQALIEERTRADKSLDEQRKRAERVVKKAENDLKNAEKKQKKAEKELKARDKAQSNYEKAGNKYNDAIKKYEKLKRKGKLSPNDEAKWLEKIDNLNEDISKAKRKL